VKSLFVAIASLCLLISIAVAVEIGHQQKPRVEIDQPSVVIEVLDPSLAWCAPKWQREIGRRFPNAVGVLVHGGDVVAGQWVVGAGFGGHATPVNEIIERYRQRHPTKTIVLLACNTGHVRLTGHPNTYYFRASVYCIPDRELAPAELPTNSMRTLSGLPRVGWFEFEAPEKQKTRWELWPEVNGNVFEAVSAE
jgi:hypothetical protein